MIKIKSKFKLFRVVLFVLLIGILITSCNASNPFLGTWSGAYESGILTVGMELIFTNNEIAIINMPSWVWGWGDNEIKCEYKYKDSNATLFYENDGYATATIISPDVIIFKMGEGTAELIKKE